MNRKQSRPMLIPVVLPLLLLTACASATPAPTAAGLIATSTAIPPTDTATPVPPTNTPVSPTDTPMPTDTLTSTSTPMPTRQTPTETPVPPSSTLVPPTAASNPTTAPAKPTSASAPIATLTSAFETRPITPLTDALIKLLGRKGIALCVLDNYPSDLTFSFPGQESQTGVIGMNYQDVNVWTPAIGRQLFSSPFTVPSNGMMCTLWQPGTYGWDASIPNVGQAQGNVTISSGQTFVLTFRP